MGEGQNACSDCYGKSISGLHRLANLHKSLESQRTQHEGFSFGDSYKAYVALVSRSRPCAPSWPQCFVIFLQTSPNPSVSRAVFNELRHHGSSACTHFWNAGCDTVSQIAFSARLHVLTCSSTFQQFAKPILLYHKAQNSKHTPRTAGIWFPLLEESPSNVPDLRNC